MLASLHLLAERVRPSTASSNEAPEVDAVHSHDRDGNLSNVVAQRELLLVATWDGVLRRIASSNNIDGEGFACIFEDDITLHKDVSQSVARRVIVHGMNLARKDGLLYLGSCGSACWDEPFVWLQNVEYRKCDTPCSHAVCVTKQRSGTLMSELRGAWQDDIMNYNFHSTEEGHCIAQLLRVHAEHKSSIWTVGTNLWSMQWVWYGDQLNGLFHRDKVVHQENHWPSARCARERSYGIVGAATPRMYTGKGQTGLFN